MGASGAGTTTLGSFLSNQMGIPHFDTDDYFWAPSEMPFSRQRDEKERAELLNTDLDRSPGWVLSGSLCGWGDFAIPRFTLVIFLWIPHDLRMSRLKEREINRYGTEAISPGGWFHENDEAFMAWASAYDTAGLEQRSRVRHEQWMKGLPCRIIRFEEARPVEDLAAQVEKELNL